ncbi:unnamed protein product [Rhizoctonia solani]|uniref:ESCRT-I complex subunit VPS28 n=1 Tax=Rhizoctonia solani TaxID=456999 RepID=A0A8H3HFB8_9AGAM|nr:unnamed protein product [Rhizoctonia solani]
MDGNRPYSLLHAGESLDSPAIPWLERFSTFLSRTEAMANWQYTSIGGGSNGPWIATLSVNGHPLNDITGQGATRRQARARLVRRLQENQHPLLHLQLLPEYQANQAVNGDPTVDGLSADGSTSGESSTPNNDLDSEARLYSTNAEREKYESQATLFGIIVALEYLERAYVRDAINAAEYTPACTRLLSQYKTMLKLVGDSVPSVEEFMRRYNMDHPAALHRVQVGVPATIEHSSEQQGSAEGAKWVAETTQSFITFMDALNLRLRAKDQLHPRLQELMTGYARFKDSAKWEGRGKIVSWLITLNAMKASDEISEDQARQLLFDIDHAYHEFFSSLGGAKDNS